MYTLFRDEKWFRFRCRQMRGFSRVPVKTFCTKITYIIGIHSIHQCFRVHAKNLEKDGRNLPYIGPERSSQEWGFPQKIVQSGSLNLVLYNDQMRVLF